jgi:uncharacterized membrane protein
VEEKKYFKDIGEAIRYGWYMFKENIMFFIVALIIPIIAVIILFILAENVKGLRPVFFLLIFILGVLFKMGFLNIFIKVTDEEKPDFKNLFSCYPLFIKFLAGTILYFLIVLGGLVLLIVPGVIWAIKYSFFPYFIIEGGLGPVDALKESAKITNGVKWDLFGFFLITGYIIQLGQLALLVGLFAAIPTVGLAYAYVYRRLLAQAGSLQDIAGESSEPAPETA